MKNLELSFSPAIALMFAGAIAISATIGIFIYYSFQSLDEANWWRNHTFDVIHATSQLRIDLSDLESDTRGYIVAQDNRFPKIYHQHSHDILNDFSRLKTLTQDGRNKNFKTIQVENLLTHRLAILNSLVTVAQSKGSSVEQKNKKIAGLIREGNLIRSVLNAQLTSAETAEKELLKAIELGGKEMKEGHRLLAIIYSSRKDTSKTIAELETYLQLNPTTPDAEQLRGVIKKLKGDVATPTGQPKP